MFHDIHHNSLVNELTALILILFPVPISIPTFVWGGSPHSYPMLHMYVRMSPCFEKCWQGFQPVSSWYRRTLYHPVSFVRTYVRTFIHTYMHKRALFLWYYLNPVSSLFNATFHSLNVANLRTPFPIPAICSNLQFLLVTLTLSMYAAAVCPLVYVMHGIVPIVTLSAPLHSHAGDDGWEWRSRVNMCCEVCYAHFWVGSPTADPRQLDTDCLIWTCASWFR